MDHETIISIATSQVASVMRSASEWPYAGYTALALLLDVAVKGMLILGIAGLVAASLRRSSAAVRHFVWTVAAAALLALPILSLMVPRWRVPVPFEIAGWTMAPMEEPAVYVSQPMPRYRLHRRQPPQAVQPPQPPQPAMPAHAPHAPYPPRHIRPPRPPRAAQFHPLPRAELPIRVPPQVIRPRVRVIVVPDEAVTADEAMVGGPGTAARSEARQSEARLRRGGGSGAATAIVGGRASSNAARWSREAARNAARRDARDDAAIDPAFVLLLVWIAGALGVAGGIVVGVLRVGRLKRNAVPIQHGWSVALLRRLCDEMGVTRPVTLLEGDADAMPMTWGILRPMVLLPSSASGWQEARLLAVLRHELAHVRRLDTLTQLIAEVACAVHWFNPVVWIMARRLRIEREMACDDAVLAAGSVASEYAAQLVALARSFRPVPATVFAAVTMATPSQLKGRVHALLDERRSRGRVAGGSLVTAWIAAVLLVVPLAAMTPVSRFKEAPASGGSPRASQWARERTAGAPYAMLGAGSAGTYALAPIGGVSILELGGKGAYVLPVPRRIKGVVVAPRAFAVPRPVPFMQQQALCWQSGAEAQRVSTRHSDSNGREEYRLNWQRAGCEIEIRMVGTVRFTRDFTDIASIANGGWVRVTEEDRGRVRRVNIEPSEGALAYDYTFDGQARPFDAAAREWLRATLVQFFRATGYAADERAAWILSDQGIAGLMREIELLRADHARRRYYQAGIAAGGLDEAQIAELMLRASRQISSDYELAQLLVETSDDIPFASATRDAFIAASRTLESDYERRRVLSAVLESAKLDAPSTAALLESAGELSSDYEKAELLIGLTKRYTLEPSLRVQYLRTASGIESDYEKRRVFDAIVAQGSLAPQDLAELLNASVTIESDYEAATLLMALSRYDLSSPALQEAYLKAASGLESDYEHRRVLSSIVRRERIAPEVLSVVLRSARSIESDYELAELLTQIARTQALTSTLREEFMRTLQTIESTHEYDRVSGVLARAEQQRRGVQGR
jgi:beta-lactamase regulating signal transducer with metallopeptidase domain